MASALADAFGGIEPVVTGEYRLGDVRHIVASPATAARDLGFRAQTRFAEGIAEFAQAPLREPALARRCRSHFSLLWIVTPAIRDVTAHNNFARMGKRTNWAHLGRVWGYARWTRSGGAGPR